MAVICNLLLQPAACLGRSEKVASLAWQIHFGIDTLLSATCLPAPLYPPFDAHHVNHLTHHITLTQSCLSVRYGVLSHASHAKGSTSPTLPRSPRLAQLRVPVTRNGERIAKPQAQLDLRHV